MRKSLSEIGGQDNLFKGMAIHENSLWYQPIQPMIGELAYFDLGMVSSLEVILEEKHRSNHGTFSSKT